MQLALPKSLSADRIVKVVVGWKEMYRTSEVVWIHFQSRALLTHLFYTHFT